jgi:hypothetical protein
MQQRTTIAPWDERPRGAGSPIRLLIESPDPALQVSDFSCFREAGIEVALCEGPARSPYECPLVRGETCGLAEHADVVLCDLARTGSVGKEVVGALQHHHAATPVLVVTPRDHRPGDEPAGVLVLPYPSSVAGQIAAVRRAARR